MYYVVTRDDDSESRRRRREDAPKERVLHTRVPAVLDQELKRLARSLRVPVSNVVRAILEDAVDAVDTVGERAEGELMGFLDRLARQRDELRSRVHAERWENGEADRPSAASEQADPVRSRDADEATDRGASSAGDVPADPGTKADTSSAGAKADAGGEASAHEAKTDAGGETSAHAAKTDAGADASDGPREVADSEPACPDAAPDLLTGVFAYQPVVLATPATCSVCGRALPAGGRAHRALFDEPGKRVFLGPECRLLPENERDET